MSQQPTHRALTGMTRRNALISGAGAVVAGSTAAVVGTRLAFDGSGAEMAAAMPPRTEHDLPVMLRLADARKGAFDVYVGTEVVHVVDRGFASRVTHATSRSRR